MLYCNYFRYFEDQIPDRNFSKSSTLGPHFSRSNEAGKCPPGTRGALEDQDGEEKGKEFAREKSAQYSEFSFFSLFPFFFISSLSSLLHEKLKISRSSKRSYLILFLLQRFVNPHFSLSSSYIICIMN